MAARKTVEAVNIYTKGPDVADKDLLAALQNQRFAYWRRDNPDKPLDLSGAEIRDVNAKSVDLSGITFQGSTIVNCVFHLATLNNADFSKAKLENVDLAGSKLYAANFTGAELHTVRLQDSQAENAKFVSAVIDSVQFNNARHESTDYSHADISGADFSRAFFKSATFDDAELIAVQAGEAKFPAASFVRANCKYSRFDRALLASCDLRSGTFDKASFDAADLEKSRVDFSSWTEASLNNAKVAGMRGCALTHGFETTNLLQDVHDVDKIERTFLDTWCNWERLSVFGRLPLFGASYTVLIFIPLFLYALAAYNDAIERGNKFGESIDLKAVDTSAEPWTSKVSTWLRGLEKQPVPNLSLWLLVSTAFLAGASTIYHIYCPDRVKQFTEEQWRHELGKPALHYWPFSWRQRWLRVTCASLYILGGVGVAAYLVIRIWRAGQYILEHSTLTSDTGWALAVTALLLLCLGMFIVVQLRKPGA